jgi:hypothetical protein
MKFSMTGQENYDLLILVSDCLIEVTTWVGLTTLPSQKSYRLERKKYSTVETVQKSREKKILHCWNSSKI